MNTRWVPPVLLGLAMVALAFAIGIGVANNNGDDEPSATNGGLPSKKAAAPPRKLDPATTGGVELTGIKPGQHEFCVRATDSSGNTGQPACIAWTVQTLGNSRHMGVQIDPQATPMVNVDITGVPAEAAPTTVRFTVDGNLKKTRTAPPYTYSAPPAGDHVLTITATAPDGGTARVQQRYVK